MKNLAAFLFRRVTVKFIKLKLFSPIMVKGEAPYENPWDSGDDYRFLIEREKKYWSERYYAVC